MRATPFPVRPAAILAAAWLSAVVAGPARGDDGGIPLGPARLHPTLLVGLTHDDNVFLTSADPRADWFTVIAPALRLTLPVRRFFLEVEGGLEARSYAELESQDATDWFVGGAVGAKFPGGLDFRLSERYAEEYLTASQEFGPGEESTVETFAASVGHRLRDALRLELGAARVAYGYERSLDRERVETSLRASGFWRFRPGVSALLEGTVTEFDYDESRAQDGSESAVALGLVWDATSRSTGLLKLGYEWKRYDREDPPLGIEDGEYYVAAAGVRHEFTRRTALQADFSHGSHESDFPGNPYYLRTAFAAGLSQRFTTKITGRVGVGYAEDAYPNEITYDNPYDLHDGAESGRRTDRTVEATVAVGFEATRWLTLEAAWERERRTSSFETFAYEATRVSLSARAAF